jgi:hypothetical protein
MELELMLGLRRVLESRIIAHATAIANAFSVANGSVFTVAGPMSSSTYKTSR